MALDGRKLSPDNLLARLNDIGAKHGIGRVDLVENRYVGMKSRGVYETPGGTILHAAHRGMESITMDREVLRLRDSLIPRYAEMIYYGYWFAPEREVLQKTIDAAQANVSGRVRLKLYKGNVSRGRAQIGNVAIRSECRDFRGGPSLSAGGCRGIYSFERAALAPAAAEPSEVRNEKCEQLKI